MSLDSYTTEELRKELARRKNALEEMVNEDVMPMIDGRSFRCGCGCNVFRHPKGKPTVFVCNSCRDRYIGE